MRAADEKVTDKKHARSMDEKGYRKEASAWRACKKEASAWQVCRKEIAWQADGPKQAKEWGPPERGSDFRLAEG